MSDKLTERYHINTNTPEGKHKLSRERLLFWVLLASLVLFSFIEWYIILTVKQLPLITSVLFFIVLNLNVIIAICLIFLSIRHLLRFFFGYRGRFLRKSLKMKLSVIFLAFSIVPTILIFFVSFFYIHSSFDQWFKHQVVKSVSDSVDLTVYYYDTTKKILVRESELIKKKLDSTQLSDIDCLELGNLLVHTEWFTILKNDGQIHCTWKRIENDLPFEAFMAKVAASDSNVIRHDAGEYIFNQIHLSKDLIGYLGVLLPKAYADKMAQVVFLSQDLKSLNPYATPLKSVYTIALIAMTALLIFSAIWIGIHVADRLTKPLHELTLTMSQVNKGEFKQIPLLSNDQVEIKVLKESYNEMILRWNDTKKQLEHALEEVKDVNFDMLIQKRLIELVLNDLDSVIFLLNEKNEIVFHNYMFKKQFIGKNDTPRFSLLPAELQTVVYDFVKKSKSKPQGLTERLIKELLIKEDNRTFEILLRTLIFRDGPENLYMAILHDVTDMQEAQALMAWQEVAKRVAHEIKNPLTPIQLLTERLQRKLDREDGVSRDDLKETFVSTLHHVELIKNLVSEFSKVANLPSVSPALGGVSTLIEKIQEIYEPLCAQNNIAFETVMDPDIPPFPYDLNAILQVFQNLTQNSIQALQGLRVRNLYIRLTVKYNRRLHLVIFTIEDNGPGIDSAIISKIFSPNFSTKEKGMGLGLSISKKIVEDHGGRIQVLSGVDVGTKFMIELPVYRYHHFVNETRQRFV